MKALLATLLLASATLGNAAVDLDAVAAAPGNHRVLLENDKVRVLQVEVLPGQTKPTHEHRWPSVIIIQSSQPAVDIRYEMRNGKLVESSRRQLPGGRPPPALYFPPDGPHAVQNLGPAPFRLIRIELKQPAAAPR